MFSILMLFCGLLSRNVPVSSAIAAVNESITNITVELNEISTLLMLENENSSKTSSIDNRNCFFSNCYQATTKGLPVYVRAIDNITDRFGNNLGWLMNDYACAHVSGAHFILIGSRSNESLLGYFPNILPHHNPATNINDAIEIAMRTCKNTGYEWENFGSEALLNSSAIQLVRNLVHRAVTSLAENLMALGRLQHSNKVLYTTLMDSDPEQSYSVVSEATIHYRCSNNIFHQSMGLLPFPTIISVLPKEPKSIYIHTEGTRKEHLCSHVIRTLFEDVSDAFPNALVVVFENENVYATMYNFIHTDTLICSSSTFCLHIAIGKVRGKVYIPPKFYGGKTNFSYQDWNYFAFKPRIYWPENVIKSAAGRKYLINALRNLNKYFQEYW